jgi:Peptidase family M28
VTASTLKALLLSLALAACASAPASGPTPTGAPTQSGNSGNPADFTIEGPLKFTARPTSGDITAIDLMSRLYVFADDSMMGRDDGGPLGATKASTYVERELRRLRVTPAGDAGSYFQDIGYRTVLADARSSITVDGQTLALNRDFVPVPRVGARPVRDNADVIFGGMLDSVRLSASQTNGKIVMVLPGATGGRGGRGGGRAGAGGALPDALMAAAAIMIVQGDSLATVNPARGIMPAEIDVVAAGPVRINVTTAAAARLLGVAPASAQVGTAGRSARLDISFAETKLPVRNVVGIIPGTDRTLSTTYVALGAHLDHVGFTNRPVDHDSVRAFNRVMRPRGANDPVTTPSAEQAAHIQAIRDSLGKLHPARRDSINNGADDDGSGSVVLLEIAEAMMNGSRPKRSVLFVWHAAEEDGLLGSRYFTDHPTVPRDSIVAQLNTDMIGRGRATDHALGGPKYLRMIGSRRLSTELGDIVERVNSQSRYAFALDYSFDVAGHPMNSYCRSDHYNYARYGIPIAYMGTSTQADYHMVSDEPQYIDYPGMARRAQFMRDLALAVGNLDHRPVVDKEKPDPRTPCRQ